MKSTLFIVIILLFIESRTTIVFSQEFSIQVYDDKQGYSSPETSCVFSDSRGFLWMGGFNGITKYDGFSFTNYGRSKGLSSNVIYCIIEDSNGNILVGTKNGINSFNGESFEIIPVVFCHQKSKNNLLLKGFFKTSKNEIYAFGGSGLFRFNRQKNSFYQIEKFKFRVNQIAEEKKGSILVASEKGLFELRSDKWSLSKLTKRLPDEEINAIEIDKFSNIWIGTIKSIFKIDAKNNIHNFNIEPNRIFDFKITSNNEIIAGGFLGKLYLIKANTLKVIELRDYIASSEILNIEEDYQGNIWLASVAFLVKLTKSSINTSNIFKDVEGPFASMTKGNKNQLFVGTLDGLYVKRGRSIQHFKPSNKPNDLIISALTWFDDSLYAGTFGGKVFQFDGNKFKLIYDNQGNVNCIYKILFINKSEYWICFDSKIVRLKNGKPTSFKIGNFYTQSAIIDKKKRIWFANYSYLKRFENEKFCVVKGTEKYSCFVTVVEDNNGVIWVGTYGDGILKIDGGKIKHFTKNNGLTNDFIASSYYDSTANVVWFGTMYGISKIQLDKCSNIKTICNYLNSPKQDYYGCIQNSLMKLSANKMLFAVGDQLFEYNDELPHTKRKNLLIDFTGFFVNNSTNYKNKNFTPINKWNGSPNSPILKNFENNVEIDFTAINYFGGEQIKYRWRLLGFDSKWTKYTNRKYATFTNLPPGTYTFEIQAKSEMGVLSKTKKISFTIETPFYLTLWFISLSILTFLSTVYGFYKYRVTKIKNESNQKILHFQKLAEAELKALRAQMNPHFMFNTINAIQDIVLGKDDKTARIYFADFAKMMRMILENSTQKLVTLEREINFLKLYLSFEKIRFKDKFEIQFVVDEEIEASFIQVPSMLIQPFIENAINHGLHHKENGGILLIKFEQVFIDKVGFLKCTIEDNGVGREAANKLNSWRTTEHRSMSTQVNNERIELLNSIMEDKKLHLKITDLRDGNLSIGTRVELFISI